MDKHRIIIEENKFGRKPTLKVSKQQGVYKIMFQPIRVTENEVPLSPILMEIEDRWSDEEEVDSDDSDLDIEYIAPATFMEEVPTVKPLLTWQKQQYEVDIVEGMIMRKIQEKEEIERKIAEAEAEARRIVEETEAKRLAEEREAEALKKEAERLSEEMEAEEEFEEQRLAEEKMMPKL